MNILNKLSLGEHVKVSKTFLQKYIFDVYKYYIVKEPDSEFLKSYINENQYFDFDKALKYYLNQSGTPSEVITSNDWIELKPMNLGSKNKSEPILT